MIIGNKKG